MRNPNPFTARQIRLLETVREKIREIKEPEPEVITNDDYEWRIKNTKQFGQIPKICFRPNSGRIKAEIVRKAELLDEKREAEIGQLRAKYGVRTARNKESRLFEAEWNNIMFKIKKATFTVGFINQLFASVDQKVADPVGHLQEIVMCEYVQQIKGKRDDIYSDETSESAEVHKNAEIKPYNQELSELK